MTNRNANFWLGLFVVFCLFIYLIHTILLPFVVGALVAYFLSPAADKLVSMGVPRGLGTFGLLFSFFFVIGVLMLLAMPIIAGQLSGLIQAMPGYINQLQHSYAPQITQYFGQLPALDSQQISGYSGDFVKYAAGFLAGIFKSGIALINALSLILITPVVAFYLIHDWHKIIKHLDSLLPRAHARTIREQVRIIDRTLAGFVRGQLNACLIMGLFYGLGLTVVGLKFGIIIGLMTGLFVIIPYVGFMFGLLIGIGVAFFQYSTLHPMLMVIGVFMVGQIIESNIITPKLVGEKVGLHEVWIIFGLLAGAALFGFVGVLLAVPVTAVIGVLIRFAMQRYLNSHFYIGSPDPSKSRR